MDYECSKFMVVESWAAFDPFEQASTEARKWNMPQFDMYTCMITPIFKDESGVESASIDIRIKMLIFTTGGDGISVEQNLAFIKHHEPEKGELGYDFLKAEVLIQFEEQYNGTFNTVRFSDLDPLYEELICSKLRELRVVPNK